MGKTYIDTVKYTIYAYFDISGIVEKPDVVGAIFGQTEGLLGEELDLRELQKNGRIGRIEVELVTESGKTKGVIKIPSSLDMVETAIIGAALETVDRVGPCDAKISINRIEDNRNEKRKKIVTKAKQLLKELINTQIPESREITEMVRKEVKASEITTYGPEKLPAGPGVDISDAIVFVEGRADVINLLKNDITNVIAIGGAKVPKTVVELSKKKETTVFLDGDRGGDIILKELLNAGVDIDFVARAPTGKEVEELTRKEIIKALRNKAPLHQEAGEAATTKSSRGSSNGNHSSSPKKHTSSRTSKKDEKKEERKPAKPAKVISFDEGAFKAELNELKGKLRARFYDEKGNFITEVQVREMLPTLQSMDKAGAIIFDGIVTQRLVDIASNKGAKYIIGIKVGNVSKKPSNLEIITYK